MTTVRMRTLALLVVVSLAVPGAGCGDEAAHDTNDAVPADAGANAVAGDGQTSSDASPGPDRVDNIRDPSAVGPKDAFLVSAKNRVDVALATSLSIVRENDGTYRVQPLLLFHEESGQFDADAALHFLERFGATRVVCSSMPLGLEETLTIAGIAVDTFSAETALEYWTQIGSVVRSGQEREALVLASYLAAEMGAPLIVAASSADVSSNYMGRHVLTVGTMCPAEAASCTDFPTLSSGGRAALISAAPDLCERLLVFVAEDADVPTSIPSTTLTPDVGGGTLSDLFTDTSAIAAYLAAARHELLVPSVDGDVAASAAAVMQAIADCNAAGWTSSYLTVVASPGHIPLQVDNGTILESVDSRHLSDTDGDGFPELATGRIMGLTASDVSSLVARSLFLQDLSPPGGAVIAWPKERYYNRIEAEYIDTTLSDVGLSVAGRYEIGEFAVSDLSAASLFFFFGHGNTTSMDNVLTSSDLYQRSLPPLFVGSVGCNSCDVARSDPASLLCLRFLRQGAAAFVGATDGDASGYNSMGLLAGGLRAGHTLGQAWRDAMIRGVVNRAVHAWYLSISPWWDFFYSELLVGDPLMDLGLSTPTTWPPPPTWTAVAPDIIRTEISLPAEPSISSVRVDGDRIFLGSFGLESQRTRGFAPPFTDGVPSYFEDRTILVIPVDSGPGMAPVRVVSVEVSEDGGPFVMVSTMPLRSSFMQTDFPIERCTPLVVDEGPGGGYYLGLVESIGGDPIDVLTLDTVRPRRYRIDLLVDRGPLFHRGDVDDNGVLDMTDAIRIFRWLFLGGPKPPCLDAADADDSEALELTDGIRILGFLFLGQAAPSSPGPPGAGAPCGPDHGDSLGCERYTNC